MPTAKQLQQPSNIHWQFQIHTAVTWGKLMKYLKLMYPQNKSPYKKCNQEKQKCARQSFAKKSAGMAWNFSERQNRKTASKTAPMSERGCVLMAAFAI